MKLFTVFEFVATLVASLVAAGAVAATQSYPTKSVRLVVPYAPGGGSDITARAIGQKLAESLGQSFVVDNRAGASGLVGTELAAKAPADGYTLLLADSAHTINTVIYAKPRYDAIKDFAPITLLATTPLALMAHPSFALSLKELLALPKAQSEKISLGMSGQGGGPHMTYLVTRMRTGLTLNIVSYKGGAPALADVVAGQIPLVFTSLAAGITQVTAGRLKGLGLVAAARHPLVPDVPTFQEAGLKDLAVNVWYGVFAPGGTPKEILSLLDRQIAKALETPVVRERFATLAIDIAPGGPVELRKILDSELKLWRDVVARSGERFE